MGIGLVASRLGLAARLLTRFVVRLAASILGATFLIIVLIEMSIPGGFKAVVLPLGPAPGSASDQRMVELYHLDDNVVERHVRWVGDAVHGDFGLSTRGAIPVDELMWPRVPISLELMLVAVAGTILFGIPLGLAAAAWSFWYWRVIRSAARRIGVRGFLISWATRRATSPQAANRSARRNRVRSPRTTRTPSSPSEIRIRPAVTATATGPSPASIRTSATERPVVPSRTA